MISIAFLGGSVWSAAPIAQEILQAKVESLVLDEIASSGSTDFFVWMKEKADLRPAHSLRTKKAKGRFVYRILRDTANHTQNGVRAQLNRLGVDYRSFYIANKILVRRGDMALLNLLAARPDVSRITANHIFQLQEPFVDSDPQEQVAGIESSISFINAPDVWALGYNGAGIVLAGNDTGLDWDHPAIKNQYRGWNGSTVDHNYNWWDATGTYPSVPDDGHGHGTHTTGTMVGDDGNGNRIGVAPGAKTIHCKNMTDSGGGSDATITECFQFDLAPWDLTGSNPDPDKAPDAVNNSWGYWYGNNSVFEDIISTLQAAGILVEVSAGNEGPGCGTLRSPGDYSQVLTTGSVNHAGGSLPGMITDFSSRGPSDLFSEDFFPDIMAPGENIRSSLPGNNYAVWSGTSMAGPHVTALVGLMWQASPTLRGDVSTTVQAIRDTAVPLAGQGANCGGDYNTGPNNEWGYGTIDALAAVQEAIQLGPPFRVQTTPIDQAVCTSTAAIYDVAVTRNSYSFSGKVGLTVSGQPEGISATFNPDSVDLTGIDAGGSILTISNIGLGSYELEVIGTSTANPEETSTSHIQLQIFSETPETVTLSQPANGVTGVAPNPFFEWSTASQASSYLLEVATDSEFSNIVYSVTVESTSHRAESMLDSMTTYYWRIRAGNVCGVSDFSSSSFTTRDVPPTLLVDDDDNAPDVRSYYEDTLDALGIAYDIWDTNNSDNEPDAATLSLYHNVIWFSGAEWGAHAGPGSAGEAALSSWLNAGSCLLISSQDYFWDRGITSFMRNYLGVYEIYEAVDHVSVTGQGSVYEGLGPYTLSYPFTNFSDEIWATADAELAFYGDVWPAAINKATETYFTTFLGYPLEAIPDLTDRQDVLTAFFNTCGGELKPILIHVGDLEGDRWDANRGRWDAGVTITVHDENENMVAGVLASGVWSNGATGSGECTTDNDGQCQIIRGGTLKNNVSAVTFSIDGLLGSGYTYDAADNHDLDGDSDGTEITVFKDPSPPTLPPGDTPMHVGDLDGSREPDSKANKWNATVTVTVHNEADDPINGITVSGTWSGGTSGGGSCTTDNAGQCSITKNNLRSNVSSVMFSVDNLTDSSGTFNYNSNNNHDPDGDSTGTSIEIPQPQP
jgi:hypothetical protein